MTAELREHIRRLVDQAPPLTETQRSRLWVLFEPVRRPWPTTRRRAAR